MAKTSSVPAAGDNAPVFELPSSSGEKVNLKDLTARSAVILFFYPKANTPGCTTEACGFRDAITLYKQAGVSVLGISPDPPKAVASFAEKFDLPYPLLADADHAIAERYGVWQEKSMYGRKYMGVARTTFIIGKDGRVAHVFEKVKPAAHEQQVLQWLKENKLK